MRKWKKRGNVLIVLAAVSLLLMACQSATTSTATPDAAPGIAGEVRSIKEISAAGPPQIVDITDADAVLLFESDIPLACSVVYGKTTEYGQIAVDQDMGRGRTPITTRS
jgi:hypothetical protein